MRLPATFILSIILMVFISDEIKSQDTKSTLNVTIVENNLDEPVPVRVKITDPTGKVAPLPAETISVMYGRDDWPERYGYQPDSSFYVDGYFHLSLNPGTYWISLSKGLEYLDQYHTIDLAAGEQKELKFEMERWINMADSGWYSADDHIHIRRSPRENPLILKWVVAEGLNVGVLLQMGDFWSIYFSQYDFGEDGVYREDENMLSTGQEEPRSHEIGHTIALVADDFVRFQNEYYYYYKVFDRIHELKGIMGYAHQGMSFHGYRGMTLDVLDGKVDFLELLQFCVEGGPLLTQNYYHFLDLGYKLTATAGSDFPWCGIGPLYGVDNAPHWNARIGNVRFYTHIDGPFDYISWKKNLVAGHTFVSSGPEIIFSVNDKLPGDELKLSRGDMISITAKAYGHNEQAPLSRLEIVAHGKVIREISPDGNNQTSEELNLNFKLKIDKGIWIAARCYAGPNQIAHTTPVYISVDGSGFQNDETFREYLALNEKYLDELENELNHPTGRVNLRAWWYKDGLMRRIQKTRKIIDSLKGR